MGRHGAEPADPGPLRGEIATGNGRGQIDKTQRAVGNASGGCALSKMEPGKPVPMPGDEAAGVMGLAMFYHLTRSAAEDTAANLVGRAVGQGWRVMIRGTDAERLGRLDAQLWLGPPETFLPHGVQGGAQDADQPVLLGVGQITNGARALMLVDGAEVSLPEATTMDRVWVIFDGADTAALSHARGQWRTLTEAGISAQYWSEESGSWAKKAEKGA